MQLDARIVSQLRRFKDSDDMGVSLSSSLKSLQINQPDGGPLSGENPNVKNHEEFESDVDVRIIGEKTDSSQRHDSEPETEALDAKSVSQPPAFGSHSASGPPTSRSIPTDSSHGSRNRAVIAPENVAHLLSESVAGMAFDREKQLWVKSRNSSKAEQAGRSEHPPSDATEEDLLGAIPDLSVDEIEEMRRIETAGFSVKTVVSIKEQVSNHDFDKPEEQTQRLNGAVDAVNSQPQTTKPHNESSAPSKNSHFASSGLVPETRATSWDDEAVRSKPNEARGPTQGDLKALEEEEAQFEEAEHEISILEGREKQSPKREPYRKPRVATVAFSSPLVNHMDASVLDEAYHIWDDADALKLEDSPVRQTNERTVSRSRRTSSRYGCKQSYPNSSRRTSFGHQPYVARPMSRLDEHEELSIPHCSDRPGLPVAVSTPLTKTSLMIPPTSGQFSHTSFQLSPLSEFTIHQIDRPLDWQPTTRRPEVYPLAHGNQVASLSTREIVAKITDVEPYEPYWEYLRALGLRNKGITTLHMLNSFCERLEELDVANNELREVNGAPSSLRCFKLAIMR